MADERDDPARRRPADTETSDAEREEGTHPGRRRLGEPGDSGPSPDAPSTSHEQEGDAGQATGNPEAAG